MLHPLCRWQPCALPCLLRPPCSDPSGLHMPSLLPQAPSGFEIPAPVPEKSRRLPDPVPAFRLRVPGLLQVPSLVPAVILPPTASARHSLLTTHRIPFRGGYNELPHINPFSPAVRYPLPGGAKSPAYTASVHTPGAMLKMKFLHPAASGETDSGMGGS